MAGLPAEIPPDSFFSCSWLENSGFAELSALLVWLAILTLVLCHPAAARTIRTVSFTLNLFGYRFHTITSPSQGECLVFPVDHSTTALE